MGFSIHQPTAAEPHIFESNGNIHASVVLTDACGDRLTVFTDPDTARRLVATINRTDADYDALLGFIEEIRDCSPDIISGRAIDPQDDVDDMMPFNVFESFQAEAAALIGRKVKAKVAA